MKKIASNAEIIYLSKVMIYYAVIGDIIKSKKISEREKFQKSWMLFLNELNNESKSNIASPYTITLGDEFQAVYKSSNSMFKDIFKIMEHIYPNKIRISIGIGKISTEINKVNAIGMDGPAFYAARDGLMSLKKIKQNTIKITKYGQASTIDKFINQNLVLIFNNMESWKLNTLKIFNKLLSEESDILKIAKELNITERAVYNNIKDKHLNDIIESIKLIKLNL